jgi:hypothetical protein
MAALALLALAVQALPNLSQVNAPDLPFDLLTVDKTLEEKKAEETSGDTIATVIDRVGENTALGT